MKAKGEETGRPAIPSRMAFGAVFINAYICTGKWPEEQYRNDEPEDGDEPPCAGGETGSKVSAQKGKANPNTSKKRKHAGRRTAAS